MSSSPSSRRNRSNELSSRKSRTDDYDDSNRDDGSEFNTRGHGPPKIEGMVSLKVDNITQRTGVNLLKKVFSKFGDLGDIYVPRYPDTFASRGFAFVRYYRKRDAEEAMRAMNGERLDGRILSIQMARYARPNSKHDKHVSSKRTHYSSDMRRNGTGSGRSYRRSSYSDRFSRRRRSRTRSRSRDRRKSDGRHGRSQSGSKSRSKKRTSRSRYRSKSKSRSRSQSRSRSRSHSRNSSKSNVELKTEIKCENNTELEDETNMNTNNNKSDVESNKSVTSPTNNAEERSHSNGR